ncbi:glycoside hydrolase family 18 protein [Xylaria sp. CBS 124048]|nr:glycoside hydrolase family 18 protein [Xylaria sp. CBS 124048]
MFPAAASTTLPRIVLYYQTTHNSDGTPVSLRPLLLHPGPNTVTHLIIAAIHINEDPDGLTLNDHPPSSDFFATTWEDLALARLSGVCVMGMLGGAAKGTYARLDRDQATFERYYESLYQLIRRRGLAGLDLDIEEPMSLAGVIRLIDRLRADFGSDFIITLSPVATALLDVRRNLSGFDYEALEVMRGKEIAWYNAQFYCGWGDASSPVMYEMCTLRGWKPEKLVMGVLTSPDNGFGYVPFELLSLNLQFLQGQFPTFGGVMGWEYFNGRPGGKERPWEWAQEMRKILGPSKEETTASTTAAWLDPRMPSVDVDGEEDDEEMPVPRAFEYDSDNLDFYSEQ